MNLYFLVGLHLQIIHQSDGFVFLGGPAFANYSPVRWICISWWACICKLLTSQMDLYFLVGLHLQITHQSDGFVFLGGPAFANYSPVRWICISWWACICKLLTSQMDLYFLVGLHLQITHQSDGFVFLGGPAFANYSPVRWICISWWACICKLLTSQMDLYFLVGLHLQITHQSDGFVFLGGPAFANYSPVRWICISWWACICKLLTSQMNLYFLVGLHLQITHQSDGFVFLGGPAFANYSPVRWICISWWACICKLLTSQMDLYFLVGLHLQITHQSDGFVFLGGPAFANYCRWICISWWACICKLLTSQMDLYFLVGLHLQITHQSDGFVFLGGPAFANYSPVRWICISWWACICKLLTSQMDLYFLVGLHLQITHQSDGFVFLGGPAFANYSPVRWICISWWACICKLLTSQMDLYFLVGLHLQITHQSDGFVFLGGPAFANYSPVRWICISWWACICKLLTSQMDLYFLVGLHLQITHQSDGFVFLGGPAFANYSPVRWICISWWACICKLLTSQMDLYFLVGLHLQITHQSDGYVFLGGPAFANYSPVRWICISWWACICKLLTSQMDMYFLVGLHLQITHQSDGFVFLGGPAFANYSPVRWICISWWACICKLLTSQMDMYFLVGLHLQITHQSDGFVFLGGPAFANYSPVRWICISWWACICKLLTSQMDCISWWACICKLLTSQMDLYFLVGLHLQITHQSDQDLYFLVGLHLQITHQSDGFVFLGGPAFANYSPVRWICISWWACICKLLTSQMDLYFLVGLHLQITHQSDGFVFLGGPAFANYSPVRWICISWWACICKLLTSQMDLYFLVGLHLQITHQSDGFVFLGGPAFANYSPVRWICISWWACICKLLTSQMDMYFLVGLHLQITHQSDGFVFLGGPAFANYSPVRWICISWWACICKLLTSQMDLYFLVGLHLQITHQSDGFVFLGGPAFANYSPVRWICISWWACICKLLTSQMDLYFLVGLHLQITHQSDGFVFLGGPAFANYSPVRWIVFLGGPAFANYSPVRWICISWWACICKLLTSQMDMYFLVGLHLQITHQSDGFVFLGGPAFANYSPVRWICISWWACICKLLTSQMDLYFLVGLHLQITHQSDGFVFLGGPAFANYSPVRWICISWWACICKLLTSQMDLYFLVGLHLQITHQSDGFVFLGGPAFANYSPVRWICISWWACICKLLTSQMDLYFLVGLHLQITHQSDGFVFLGGPAFANYSPVR